MNTRYRRCGHAAHQRSRDELARRIAHVSDELQRVRCQFHHTHEAVLAAEYVLTARKLEREEAALLVAELADLLEGLQRDLTSLDAADARATATAESCDDRPELLSGARTPHYAAASVGQ
jgi:hypothetical protein